MRSLAMAAVAVLLAMTAAAAATPGVGQSAPDFTLSDAKGRPVTLSGARGSKVVLVFYRGYW